VVARTSLLSLSRGSPFPRGLCLPEASGASFPSEAEPVGSLSAKATDPFAHHATDAVTFAWSQVSGPGAATFQTAAQANTTAVFPVAGNYVVRVVATGGGSSQQANVPVTVTAANQPPVVAMGPGGVLQLPAKTLSLAATVTDDGLPLNGQLSQFWSVVSGPSQVAFSPKNTPLTTATFVEPGTYVLQLTASDGQLTSSKSVEVEVKPVDGAKPVVALTGPDDGGEITSPTAITGTVSGGTWKLEYRLGGDGEGGWVPFASGTGPQSGTLATFDPTLLLNGMYAVRLTASASGGSSEADFSASVTRNMKVGYFTLAFTDLQVPVSGLPITITRRYDSRDKESHDFGVGWTLDIKNVRVEESRPTGRAWQQKADPNTYFPSYHLVAHKSHQVTVTFGGNKVYRFRAKPFPEDSFLQPIPDGTMSFEALAPTIGTLVTLDDSDYMVRPGNPGQLTSLKTLEPLELDRFQLTTEDGTVWTVSKSRGVEAMQDRVGNTLVVDDHGITHSSGKSVTFERDAKGRIVAITDPNGNVLHYTYDAQGDLVRYTDRVQAEQKFSYQSDHLLLDYTDANGHRAVRNDYDEQGRLLSMTDAKGKTTAFVHNVNARTEQVTNRLGDTTTFEYDTRGNVTKVTDALGGVKTMTYDGHDNKLSETNELGFTTTFTYDNNDNEASRTDPLGHTWSKTWNDFRQVLTDTDPLGHTTTHAYSASGLLLFTTDPLGHTTTYTTHATTGNLLATTDPLGNATHYAYDADGRVTQQTDALGHATMFTYDANGNKLSETTTRTKAGGVVETLVTSYQYDAHDRLLKTTFPDGSSTRTVLTPTGKAGSRIDELGRVTAFSYNALEQLVSTTFPDGTTTSSSFDDEGRTASRTDQAGRATTMAYDALGRLTTTTHPDGSFASQGYDAAGRSVSSTNENGHTSLSVFDNAGRVVQRIDALGNVTTTVYEDDGQVAHVTDPLGHVTASTYDNAGRLVTTTFADGSTQHRSYDALGRVTATVDELGRTTATRLYDALGRLTSVTDALGHTVSYVYNELGQLISQTDANGHTTSFAFDNRGHQIARTLPDGATETKTFDAAGNALTRTDFAGRTTIYAYDAMNRQLARSYPDGSGVSFAYTPTGRRASFSDSRGTTTYAYDARDRVSLLTYPDGRSLGYSYDALGHRTALTANVGGQALTTAQSYDAAERPALATDPLGHPFGASYDGAGRRGAMTYPNGTQTNYGYDARNRSTTLTTTGPGPSTIQGYALALDAAGRRMAIDEADGTHRSFGYDLTDRLVSESVSGGPGPQYEKSFSYDPAGNRISQVTTGTGSGSLSYAYDDRDRLLTEGTTAYTSDVSGNVTSRTDEASYAWDFDNRLSSATLVNGTIVAHQYDVDGNRVKTTVTPPSSSAISTDFLVDPVGGLSQVVADSSGGTLSAVYVRIGVELLAVVRPNGGGVWATRFVHHDAIDSVRVLTDEAGLVVDTRAYEAFGMRLLGGSDPLPFGFAGEPLDTASGLAYHRARWLDPRVGRFLGEDPLARCQGCQPQLGSLYSYGGNNPVLMVDPTGEFSLPSAAAMATFAAHVVSGSFALAQVVGGYRAGGNPRISPNEIKNTSFNSIFSLGNALSLGLIEPDWIYEKAQEIIKETKGSHPYGPNDGYNYLFKRRNKSFENSQDLALAAAEHFFVGWKESAARPPTEAYQIFNAMYEVGYDGLKLFVGLGPFGYYAISGSENFEDAFPVTPLTKAAIRCGLAGFAYGATDEGRKNY